MLNVDPAILDKVTEALYRVLNGKTPAPVALPEGHPDDEVRQVVTYTNRFLVEFNRLAEAMDALSKGYVESDAPKGRMAVLQSFKNLHANLRHLTWKTQQIAGGDLTQRVKLAYFLGKGKTTSHDHILFIFDEPTTGLHFHDINKLLKSVQSLINQGNSVVMIEHNMEIIKSADWIIDLGPEGGDKNGGHIVFEGTPEELVKLNTGYTAQYLKTKFRN